MGLATSKSLSLWLGIATVERRVLGIEGPIGSDYSNSSPDDLDYTVVQWHNLDSADPGIDHTGLGQIVLWMAVPDIDYHTLLQSASAHRTRQYSEGSHVKRGRVAAAAAVLVTHGIARRVDCRQAVVVVVGSGCTSSAGRTNRDLDRKEARAWARLEVYDLYGFAPRHHESFRRYQSERNLQSIELLDPHAQQPEICPLTLI